MNAARAPRLAVVIAVSALLLAACGSDSTTSTSSATTGSTSSSSSSNTSSSTGATAEQPAIWPAADAVFLTPESAAQDFVTKVLQVPATLGDFRQGDSRSGEIELFSSGESGTAAISRGMLLLRQLGPDDGWFIIGVANDNASITSPETGSNVPAGPLSVEGKARGFEANVVVSAFVPGDAANVLDKKITSGGAFETPEPFTVSLDLSAAHPGQVVTILVRGGTGLETDPGEIGAIPVVISS